MESEVAPSVGLSLSGRLSLTERPRRENHSTGLTGAGRKSTGARSEITSFWFLVKKKQKTNGGLARGGTDGYLMLNEGIIGR